MGLVDWIRPDPKCRHGRTRGTCLKCTGAVPAGLPGKRTKDLRMSVQKTKKVKR
jgi:hypothetical protein